MKITTNEFLLRIKIEEILERRTLTVEGSYEEIATDIAKIFLQPDVSGQLPLEKFPDNEAGGIVFCGKCGKQK